MSVEQIKKEKEFIGTVNVVNEWIKANIADARMYYGGNEDEGHLSYIQDSKDPYPLPQWMNENILKVASIACVLFITASFRKDIININEVKRKNPAVEFYVEVGEKDSFGPVTYVLITKNFQIVIA